MFKLNFSSIQGKVPLYKGAGSGRDTYVMHDSGGFVKASCADSLIRSGSQVRAFSATRPQKSIIEGKKVIYRSNGSGRDGYIVMNSGGFTARTSRSNANEGFLTTLRTYDRIKTPVYGTRDFFQWAQTTRTGKEVYGELDKQKTISDLTRRLSQPKATYNFKVKSNVNTRGTLQGLKHKLLYSMEPKLTKSSTMINSPSPSIVDNMMEREEIRKIPKVQVPSRNTQPQSLLIRHQKSKSATFLSPKTVSIEGVRSVRVI